MLGRQKAFLFESFPENDFFGLRKWRGCRQMQQEDVQSKRKKVVAAYLYFRFPPPKDIQTAAKAATSYPPTPPIMVGPIHEDISPTDASTWTAERLVRASYKDLGTPAQVEERFYRHLLEYSQTDLELLLSTNSSTTRDYSLELDMFDLCWEDAVLGQLLLKYPSTLLPLLENAIVRAQRHILQSIQQPQDSTSSATASNTPIAHRRWTVKGDKGNSKGGIPATRVHARLVQLPPTCCRTSVASMNSSDVGKIVQLSGTVVRTSPVQMYESARTYKCTGKKGCGRTFLQKADLEQVRLLVSYSYKES